MADYLTNDTDLKAVADAIRTKGGTSAPLTYPDGFVSAIGVIAGGDNYKKWTVTIAERLSSQTYVFATAPLIAAHYKDANAVCAVIYKGELNDVVYHDITSQTIFNEEIIRYRVANTPYYGVESYRSSSVMTLAPISVDLQNHQVTDFVQANDSGQLYIRLANRTLAPGEYEVRFSW